MVVTKELMRASPALLVFGYMLMSLSRSLFAQGMHVYSLQDSEPLLSSAAVVLWIEICKLCVALTTVLLWSSRSFGLQHIELFLAPASLYFVNNSLFYWILGKTSAGTISLLMHLRLPLTAIVHHFLIRGKRLCRLGPPCPWFSLV